MESAYILVHTEHVLGKRHDSYEWKGPKNGVVIVRDECVDELPWPIKKLEYMPNMRGWSCIRTDVDFWWFTDAKIKIANALQWVNIRLLMTCKIWGIGYFRDNMYPSWRDVFTRKPKKTKNE